MRKLRGFTLIELLVVIAIIAILATLVITQLGNARVKAANSAAKSDVQAAGNAIEAFKADDTNSGGYVIGTKGTAGSQFYSLKDTASVSGSIGSLVPLFTGVLSVDQATNGTASTYGAKISKTPSTGITYGYFSNTTPAATLRLVSGSATAPATGYTFYASGLVNDTDTAFKVSDGSTGFVNGAPTAP